MASRFWLRPKWLFGHALCLLLVVLFVNLGFWQLRRHDEKQARNALIEARTESEPVELDDALAGGVDVARYQRVSATGRWDPEGTVLVRSRSLDGAPGFHVVTPLDLGRGTLLVNRGFAPLGRGEEDAILEFSRPQQIDVTVEGILLASEERGSFGPRDADGVQRVVNRIDVDRLGQQVRGDVVPLYLQLSSADPADEPPPTILPEPTQDDGPHLSYAVQWFIFATVGAVGWPLLLRKTAREQERDVREEAPQPA